MNERAAYTLATKLIRNASKELVNYLPESKVRELAEIQQDIDIKQSELNGIRRAASTKCKELFV